MKRVKLREGARHWVNCAIGVVAALGMVGFLAAALGLVPVAASSGHWPVTRWILHFTMGRSVATHSIGIKVPALEGSGLAAKGAGHFHTGCAPCHGRPGKAMPEITARMTPHPPYLPPRIELWEPEELFYIVKHGVKFTGMPAWPAIGRDDEVWAVVAFLLASRSLDEAGYLALVYGEGEPRADLLEAPSLSMTDGPRGKFDLYERCGRCHGGKGDGGASGTIPALAGQKEQYLLNSLAAYAEGKRHSGMMGPVAAGLDRRMIEALARHYAGMDRSGGRSITNSIAAAVTRGEAIAREGIQARKVPACADCHGPFPVRSNEAYPFLAGQHASYLELQLKLFRDGRRGGSRFAHLMEKVAPHLTDEEISDVAAYYSSLLIEESGALTGGR